MDIDDHKSITSKEVRITRIPFNYLKNDVSEIT